MLQYIAQRRWIPWHLFCVAALVACVWMASWQWEVATSPMPAGVEVSVWRNYAYAINWVVFAVVAVWFWWRFLRDQMQTERAEQAEQIERAEQQPVPTGDVSGALRSSAGVTGRSVPPEPDVEPVVRQRRFDPFADA